MPARRSQRARVLVSGLGPVTPVGLGVDDLAESMSAATMVRQPAPGKPRGALRMVTLPEFELSALIEAARPCPDPRSRCALAAGALAWASAAVQHDEVNPERCGISFAGMLDDTDARAGPGADAASEALASQFVLRGYREGFRGGLLSGAQALECAVTALRSGRADLMMVGGADVATPTVLQRLAKRVPPGAPAVGQGAAVLVVETEDALEKREGYAFCELGAVLCRATAGEEASDGPAEVLRQLVRDTLEEAGVWEGDIGMVFLCSAASVHPEVGEVERTALSSFSEVPLVAAKRFAGETFAAGFPLECITAADVLNVGVAPPKVSFEGVTKGVEFWIERRPELMGDAVLVAGCTPDLAAAAVLRTV